ncbi:MAG: alpha-galactosidase [Mariniphaga sp.]|nr:alpha-galactosidase [Mariniphaga sp.]
MTSIEQNRVSIESDFIKRELILSDDYGIYTNSFINKITGTEYCKEIKSCEFVIGLNDTIYMGYKKQFINPVTGNNIAKSEKAFNLISANKESNGIEETLIITLEVIKIKCLLELYYEVNKNFPAMRKAIKVINNSNRELHINYFYFDAINYYPGRLEDIEVFNEYGLNKIDKASFGETSQAMLQLHNNTLTEGMIVTCNSPSSIKRIYSHLTSQGRDVLVGYNSDTIPFHKFLKPGKHYLSHSSYVFFYNGERNSQKTKNNFIDCIRTYLPEYSLSESMYCTWIPFNENINEKIIMDLIDKASKIGLTYFLIDEGWFKAPDWQIDKNKFPNGLEIISKEVKKKGMKFGLWFNIGSAYGASQKYKKYYAIKSDGGIRCHGYAQTDKLICAASKYRNVLSDKLIELAEKYKVDYFKLDFTITKSVYGFASVGCYSTKHSFHKNQNDSVIEMYNSMQVIRNRIKNKKPDIIIDFTFESFGHMGIPDISSLQYNDLHHISNYNTNEKSLSVKALDIRNYGYRVCNLLPPERILLSLICFDGKNSIENIMSSFISTPLLTGDLRSISSGEMQKGSMLLKNYKKISKNGQLKYLVKFKGDNFPYHNEWDGFARFNSNGEGMIFLFKNKSGEDVINVKIDAGILNIENKVYVMIDSFTNNVISEITHNEFKKGITFNFGHGKLLSYTIGLK